MYNKLFVNYNIFDILVKQKDYQKSSNLYLSSITSK